MGNQDDRDVDPDSNFEWLTPMSYPSRCTNEFAEGIAWDVLNGASIRAAAAARGVSPQRVRQWLLWGEEAYRRDANEYDSHASYLNLFLKYMQAIGMAAVPEQQRVHASDPKWWLSHNPEQRFEWADKTPLEVAVEQAPLMAPIADAEPVNVVEAQGAIALPTADLREALKTLVQSAPVPKERVSGLGSESNGQEQPQENVG